MQYYECDVPWWWLIMTTTKKMFLIEKSQVILVSPNLKLNPNPNDLFYKSALTFRPWNAKQLFFIFFLPLDTLRWFEIFPLPAEPHGGAPGHEAQLPSSSSQGNVSNKKEQKRKHCQLFVFFFCMEYFRMNTSSLLGDQLLLADTLIPLLITLSHYNSKLYEYSIINETKYVIPVQSSEKYFFQYILITISNKRKYCTKFYFKKVAQIRNWNNKVKQK